MFPQFLPIYPLVLLTALCQHIVMVCIYCKSDTQVINSRHQKRVNSVWRRRQCQNCFTIFTSIETPDYSYSIVVHKPSDKLEPFSRDKLFVSVYFSLKHRKTALGDARAITNTVIGKLGDSINGAELDLSLITSKTHQVLKQFDKAGAVHYQAYYMNK